MVAPQYGKLCKWNFSDGVKFYVLVIGEPGVNNMKPHGRWAFAEFTEVYQIEADFKAKVESEFSKMIEGIVKGAAWRVK